MEHLAGLLCEVVAILLQGRSLVAAGARAATHAHGLLALTHHADHLPSFPGIRHAGQQAGGGMHRKLHREALASSTSHRVCAAGWAQQVWAAIKAKQWYNCAVIALHSGRTGPACSRYGGAAASRVHLGPDLLGVSSHRLQHTSSNALTLSKQAKQDVLSANVVVACTSWAGHPP